MKVGTGWIGWTEQQTLDTTIPAIHAAHAGRIDMLKAIFGSDEPAPAAPATAGLVAQLSTLVNKKRGKSK